MCHEQWKDPIFLFIKMISTIDAALSLFWEPGCCEGKGTALCFSLLWGGSGGTLLSDQNLLSDRILVLMGVNSFLYVRTFSYQSGQHAVLSKCISQVSLLVPPFLAPRMSCHVQ